MDCILIPQGARILVETDEFKYTGVLVIPDNAKRRPTTGVIRAAGPQASLCTIPHDLDQEHSGPEELCIHKCMGLHIGDRVLYGQFSGTLVQFKGQPAYTIFGADEVLAKVVSDEVLDYTAAG